MTVLLLLQNLSMLLASSTRPSGNSLGLVGQRIMLNVLGGKYDYPWSVSESQSSNAMSMQVRQETQASTRMTVLRKVLQDDVKISAHRRCVLEDGDRSAAP